MAIELLFTPETHVDIDEAYAWRRDRRPGLGKKLLENIADTLQGILYEIVEDSYRQALVKRFPYSIIYGYDSTNVTIYAVTHTARDPAVWRQRLP